MLDLTVIIPTQANGKRKSYTELCNRTLSYFTPLYKRIIIANGEGNILPDIRGTGSYIYQIPEMGQCHAVNYAVKNYVTTKYIMVTNDDMLYGAGWNKGIEAMIEQYPVLCPNLLEPQPGAPTFRWMNGIGEKLDKEFNFKLLMSFLEQYHQLYKEPVVQDGFNLPFITRTDIFNEIEGYDEGYDPYGANSDSDLLYKFMIAGLHPQRLLTSLVWHFSLKSSEQTNGTAERDDWFKNRDHFTHKWGFERQMESAIWFAGGENGIRIPTKEKPYLFEHAAGHGIHPGYDCIEYHPAWEGKFGEPFYGNGKYYGQ